MKNTANYVREQAKRRQVIIDKVFDRIVKGEEFQDFVTYKERTFQTMPKIAARLGCSVITVKRMIDNGRLLYYLIPRRRYAVIATNETMIRMSFAAWHRAAQVMKRESRTNRHSSGTRGNGENARTGGM